MKYLQIAAILLLLVGFLSPAHGQTSTEAVDSAFVNYMDNAWKQIRESRMSDSLQHVYSSEFYHYYLENQDTETGRKALRSAFLMWGNTGHAEHLTDALSTISYDSGLWRYLITSITSIYRRSEELDSADLHEFFDYLADNLLDPKSRSEVLLSKLRMKSRQEEYRDEAVQIARELVEMDAADFYVRQGLGFLHEMESLNIGQKAPEFEAQTIHGEYVSLESLQGNYVLMEFWATWCGPCLPEIPYLKTLQEQYQDRNFKVLGFSLDRDRETLFRFIDEKQMEWPQIFLEDGWEGELARKFNVSGIPRMYLLDPDGTIIARDLRGEEMVSEIEELLGP